MIPSQHVCLHNKFRVNGRVHILSITAFNRKSCVVKLQKLLTLNLLGNLLLVGCSDNFFQHTKKFESRSGLLFCWV